MRSRTVRLTISLLVLLACGASAFFLVTSEKQIAESRVRMRAFDLRARETRDEVADLRAAQQAYVAAGQGLDFWMPKVDASRDAAAAKASLLRAAASSSAAKVALDKAAEAMTDFGTVDARARDYLKGDQELMAADVVFTEGGQAAAAAAGQVETARVAEQQALDAAEAAVRKQEAFALLGSGVLGVLVMFVLAATGARRDGSGTSSASADTAGETSSVEQARIGDQATRRHDSRILSAAAELCTEFGRVHDIEELNVLLGRAATIMEASGLVVWLGSPTGADLRPLLAHGYSPQTLGRMPSVPRSADNAAAAAYRTGRLQIVMSKPGGASGAIVAPLLSADGCIGALSIEIRGGGETSDTVQALSGIFAAQLAAVLAASAAESSAAPGESKAARG